MTVFDDITKNQLREFLVKNHMAHDGAWFFYTCMELGIDKVNHLNKSAIKMLAEVEQKRLLQLMGWQDRKITTFEDLKTLINNAFSVVKGDFMDFEYSFPAKNIMRWVMHKCWAYEGMKKLGVEKDYQCGVLWRVMCWIKNTGVKFEMNPIVKTCLLNTQGKCEGEILFLFE
ncbi:MAG: hypothetical protein RBG13Loki_2294 [Promethearchaeota archaeon CR_4]|nr:MAG: hypothetical protein RBG13Loki_2294 [Candidatus Lokiarchaeota archaeon CR_4]